jgi:glycosyltransferase involved in cell wall biosynthesis
MEANLLGRMPVENAETKEEYDIESLSIAQVCPRYHPYIGGVETHVKEISERLAKRGVHIEVLTTDPKGDQIKSEEVNGVTIRRFKSWAPSESYYFSEELRNYLKKNSQKYDVIHAHSYHAFPSLYASWSRGKARLVFTPHYHGEGHTPLRNLLHKPYRPIGGAIFRRADRIVAVSEYEKQLILKNFKVNESIIEVVPNGVNKEEFKGLKRREKNHRTILCVTRLEEYKGVQHLIRVLPELEEDIKLEIVVRGSYQKNLFSIINDLGIKTRVEIVGGIERSELLQRYVDADLFALLSRNEAYGITVAEALAAGTPCVVAKASALTEWVDDKNCFGVNLPSKLPELRSVIGKVIGNRVSGVNLLDWDEVSEKLIKLYGKTKLSAGL